MSGPLLGDRVRDKMTSIDGTFIARTQWADRSDEVAILRDGTDGDGRAWDLHWFPAMRLERAQ